MANKERRASHSAVLTGVIGCEAMESVGESSRVREFWPKAGKGKPDDQEFQDVGSVNGRIGSGVAN